MKNGVRLAMCSVALGIALCLVGCKNDMRNVEQRDYATVLVISQGKGMKRYRVTLGIAKERRTGEDSETEECLVFETNTFEELSTQYELTQGKDLSLSHLKVILLGYKKEEQKFTMNDWQDALLAMDENEEIAKTCPVLLLPDEEGFLEYLRAAKEPVGTYVSDLVAATEKKGMDVPWLKDYLRVIREGDWLYYMELVEREQGFRILADKNTGLTRYKIDEN